MCLEELLVADVFGCEWGVGMWGCSFFIMIHVDGVTQNIQLVSSLLQSYWSSFPENLYLLEVSRLPIFRILLYGTVNGTVPTVLQ